MQLPAVLDAYLVQLAANGRSDHTLAQRARHVRPFVRWLRGQGHDGDVEGVGHEDVARFLASDAARLRPDGRSRKATTANALRSSLRCFLGFAHDAGYAPAHAGRLIRRARCAPPPPRGLADDERRRLLAALDQARTPAEVRDRALFRLLLEAGLRVGSAVALDVEDLDVERAELRLRMKGQREDTAVIPSRVASLLADLVGERTSGPLFLARHGGRLTTRSVRRRLALWTERAAITRPVSPHTLRHDFAQRLLDGTGDAALVQRALCHASIASTMRYCRAGSARLRSAVEEAQVRAETTPCVHTDSGMPAS